MEKNIHTEDKQHPFDTDKGRDWLVSMLRMGPGKVTFTKSDGTLREMRCTLQEGVAVPYEKKTEKVKEPNPEILAVWDLDKQAWRSFRINTIKTFSFDLQ